MNLLADECCPRSIVAALRRAGHDVLYVLESHSGEADDELASVACDLDRVLITEDYDFGELVVRHGVELPGLVILALLDQASGVRIQRVLEVVGRLGDSLRGHITIIEPGRERVRPIGGD